MAGKPKSSSAKSDIKVRRQRRRHNRMREDLVKEIGPSFSLGEAAAFFGMKRESLRKWIQDGVLKLGDDYFISHGGHYRMRGKAIKRIMGIPDD